jgi:sulfite reductase (NADPH) hemoprotein beta-component
MSDPSPPKSNLSEAEILKASSRYLRGTIVESLADPLTGAVQPDDNNLLKFHGTYQQDDRDLRDERARQKLEPAYEFMVRIATPGGVVTPQQWLEVDRIAREYGDGSLRLTTRQAFELHGVLKWNLRQTIHDINQTLLTTLAACGDVNRNVMCNPNPYQSEIHGEVYALAAKLSQHLSPRTTAYHEIWIRELKDEGQIGNLPRTEDAGYQKVADSRPDDEPIYGPTYLPRKFKIAIAVPPSNDVDVLANDLGLIAIVEDGRLAGFNVSVGGGMGMTHGEKTTYPNLAWVIGFCRPEQILDVAEKVVLVQRDFGDRTNRKHARLKYTIDDRGVEWFKGELHQRLGWQLEPSRPYHFDDHGDRYGWVKGTNGKWHLTLFIENGRVRDWDDYPLLTALSLIAREHQGDFRLTPNEHLIIADIAEEHRGRIEQLVAEYRLSDGRHASALRRNAMACVSLPKCGLAMAEAERYLPQLLTKLEAILKDEGLGEDEIVVRVTGCPNGCARPYIAEIGLVGKAPGRYNLYLGADFAGQRLNRLYQENIDEDDILAVLRPLFHHYAQERKPGERFGDFVIRAGYVREVKAGREFHGV